MFALKTNHENFHGILCVTINWIALERCPKITTQSWEQNQSN